MLLVKLGTSHIVGIPDDFKISCTMYTDVLSASSLYTVLGILKLTLLPLQKNLMFTLLKPSLVISTGNPLSPHG